MNGLKQWVTRSREQERRAPKRYLSYYPDLLIDETHVLLTEEQLKTIVRNCGRYDHSFPTGAYLGKMFVSGDSLCWFGIDKNQPMTHCTVRVRKIEVVN